MAIKDVLTMGDPLLYRVAEAVTEFNTPQLHQLLLDMQDTMDSLNGAGLAAPQIGVNLRVVIFGAKENPRYADEMDVPYTVLINPQIEILGSELLGMWEGCLSVPGMRGYVERPAQIRYAGYDQFGERLERTVDGFHAIVVQHECDHLDGILYPMKLSDPSRFGFETELTKRTDYP